MPEFPPHYAPLAAFVAPSVGRTELWRTLAGVLVACTVAVVLGAVSELVLIGFGWFASDGALRTFTLGTTPWNLIGLLFAYLPLTIGIGLATVAVVGRRLFSLIGPTRPAILSFLWVALPLMLLFLALMPLSVFDANVVRHLSPAQQLPWLPLALLGLLIQTGTEELLFRGYLQQQLAARWRAPWVWMGIPAVIFGALHYSPQEYGLSAWFVVGWAILFGLAAADLTARTGNLGAAVGMHFANNAATMLFVGVEGRLDALTLFSARLDLSASWSTLPYLAVDTLTLLVSWLLARLFLRV